VGSGQCRVNEEVVKKGRKEKEGRKERDYYKMTGKKKNGQCPFK